ncbi:hypothetical protein L7F22_009241 [Adiantum nelumboides]|nr:hypothetical protein [Adiantum nelumboides]
MTLSTSAGPSNLVNITSPDHFTSLMSSDLNRVSLLNFWASWAEPCEQMNVVVKELAEKYPQILCLNIEAEEQPDVSESFDVDSVPSFILLRGHTLLSKISGANAAALSAAVASHASNSNGSVNGGGPSSHTASAPQAPPTNYAAVNGTQSSQGTIGEHSIPDEETPEQLDERCRKLMEKILGHQKNEKGEAIWQNSELRKIILSKDAVWGVREDRRGNLVKVEEEVAQERNVDALSEEENQIGPKRLNFLLFGNLPAVIIEDQQRRIEGELPGANQEKLLIFSQNMQDNEEIEQGHTELLGRLLDLRNANGKGIQVENIRRITNHFGKRSALKDGKEQGLDTGSPEVQAARAKILKYLKSKSLSRYNAILPRIGIEPRAVEGEVTVPGKPLMKASM